MARITLGSLVNSIKGSIGEMVYSSWKGIPYVRAKALTVGNPASSGQANIRSRISECSKYWYDTLTQAQRDAWDTYAAALVLPAGNPGDLIRPTVGPLSGFNAFMRNNMLAFSSAVKAMGAFVAAAPVGVTPPDPVTNVAASFAAGNITVTWVEGTVKGTRARIWLRSNDIPVHTQICATVLANALTMDIPQCEMAQGKTIPFSAVEGMFDIQMDVIDDDGQPSAPSTIVRNVVVS